MPAFSSIPQVIFLDAVGTLFGVRGSVGEIYGAIAQDFGVKADPDLLNQAFFQQFRKAPPMAFPDAEVTSIPNREFEWWRAIALHTFDQVDALEQFTDFDRFFDELYGHFATSDPWILYPETLKTLTYWRHQGIQLGILSNFDSRIHRVLDALGLTEFLSSVTISTEVGAPKPDLKIYQAALAKHGCSPEVAWHIGDSFKEDYEGAKAAGLRAIWLKRRD